MGKAPRLQLPPSAFSRSIPVINTGIEYDSESVEGQKIAALKTDLTELVEKLVREDEVQELVDQLIKIEVDHYELVNAFIDEDLFLEFVDWVGCSAKWMIEEGSINKLKDWYIHDALNLCKFQIEQEQSAKQSF
ncbi:hypothetical protein E4T47_07154 [Aureobasidium subglaciale]|nr:hypothetical protein E4T47_07154 [Aureobasidium subglaciale]